MTGRQKDRKIEIRKHKIRKDRKMKRHKSKMIFDDLKWPSGMYLKYCISQESRGGRDSLCHI